MMKYLTSLVTMRYYNDESMPIAYHLPKFVSTVSSFLESSQVVYWVSPYNRHLERKREVSATHHLMWEFTCWFDYVCYNSLDVLHKSQSAHNMSWPPVLPGRRVTYIYINLVCEILAGCLLKKPFLMCTASLHQCCWSSTTTLFPRWTCDACWFPPAPTCHKNHQTIVVVLRTLRSL